jgi:4a-hydroxytetrahydrobiopterin dehydratase
MGETVTPKQFHEVDWRVVRNDACTHVRTGSFAAGLALVGAIGRLADAANHHPDVDLRSDGVTVRLRSGSNGRLSERDVALARQISAAASELDLPIDLNGMQSIQVAIDALVIPDVLPFWRAVSAIRRWMTRIWLTPTSRGRRSGSSRWTRRAPNATGSTSMSTCRTTRRRRASRRRSPRVVTW